jgi:hypothetical protein
MLYPYLTLSQLDVQSCNAAWNYCYRTSVQLPGGADSVPVGLGYIKRYLRPAGCKI